MLLDTLLGTGKILGQLCLSWHKEWPQPSFNPGDPGHELWNSLVLNVPTVCLDSFSSSGSIDFVLSCFGKGLLVCVWGDLWEVEPGWRNEVTEYRVYFWVTSAS